MKSILQAILVNSIAIAVAALIIPSINYDHSISTLIIAAIVLGIGNSLIKPILHLIFLPVTIITLGIAGWLINALILLGTTIVVPNFNIEPWQTTIANTPLAINLFWSYIITAFVLNIIIRIIHSVLRND